MGQGTELESGELALRASVHMCEGKRPSQIFSSDNKNIEYGLYSIKAFRGTVLKATELLQCGRDDREHLL